MPFGSYQIFKIAIRHLPKGRIQKIFTQKMRCIYKWSADPRHCEATARNPIDRIRILLDEINIAGYGDYARAAIDYMAAPLGGRFIDIDMARSDKGSVDGEIADTLVSIGELSSIIRTALEDDHLTTAERIKIKDAGRAAIREIEQLLDVSGVNLAG
jgi:hypothetical protein